VERHDCTENSENDISLPLDVVEGWCHEVGKGKVEDPVGCSGDTDALRTVLQREDLCCIDPCSGSL
jgi:hypothetical protein